MSIRSHTCEAALSSQALGLFDRKHGRRRYITEYSVLPICADLSQAQRLVDLSFLASAGASLRSAVSSSASCCSAHPSARQVACGCQRQDQRLTILNFCQEPSTESCPVCALTACVSSLGGAGLKGTRDCVAGRSIDGRS